MKRFFSFISLIFILGLTSCSKTVKYSPGDSWTINISDEFKLIVKFEKIDQSELVCSLDKYDEKDSYNFAIKADIPCDYLYFNNETLYQKSPGVIPISYYTVPNFDSHNQLTIPFRDGTEAYRKIDIVPYNLFVKVDGIDYLGIRIILYK